MERVSAGVSARWESTCARLSSAHSITTYSSGMPLNSQLPVSRKAEAGEDESSPRYTPVGKLEFVIFRGCRTSLMAALRMRSPSSRSVRKTAALSEPPRN